MSNNNSDKFFLESILYAIDEIEYHRHSKSDPKTAFRAITLELMTIGEACTKISSELKNKYQNIDWVDMAGTRHKIVHEYFRINQAIIESIVSEHLEDLRHNIEAIIREQQ
jgi:uncharacterized protein with HEPN domain